MLPAAVREGKRAPARAEGRRGAGVVSPVAAARLLLQQGRCRGAGRRDRRRRQGRRQGYAPVCLGIPKI